MTLLLGAAMLTGCLNDDDNEVDYTLYGDAAVASISMGQMNCRVFCLTKDGTKDSTYISKVEGSKYPFAIDQVQNLIYNPDSLPMRTDVKHVLLTIGTKNGSGAFLKSPTSDSIQYVSATDSVDLSQERELQVYPLGGGSYRKYKLRVNVHKELADTFVWRSVSTNSPFLGAERIKAFAVGENIAVFTLKSGSVEISLSALDDGSTWRKVSAFGSSNVGISAVKQGGTLFLKSDNTLYKSTDGEAWAVQNAAFAYDLAAAGKNALYALDNGRMMKSQDGGISWSAESADFASENAVLSDISSAVLPVQTNKGVERIVVVGNRDAATFPNDTAAVALSCLDEANQATGKWTMYEGMERDMLPRMQSLCMDLSKAGLVACGIRSVQSGSAAGANTAVAGIYVSHDGGLSWHLTKEVPLAKDLQSGSKAVAMAVDKDNYIWLLTDKGDIRKGRLNDWGWK